MLLTCGPNGDLLLDKMKSVLWMCLAILEWSVERAALVHMQWWVQRRHTIHIVTIILVHITCILASCVYYNYTDCSLSDLSPSLVEVNRVCGSVSSGRVCYSGDSVGSVAVYFCDNGYKLEGDSTRECLSSGHWNGTTPHCVQGIMMTVAIKCLFCSVLVIDGSCSDSTAIIVGVVCSLIFLIPGVLLGVVTLYLILKTRGKLSGSTSLSPSPLPPAVTYEEVGVSGDDKNTAPIQWSLWSHAQRPHPTPHMDKCSSEIYISFGKLL